MNRSLTYSYFVAGIACSVCIYLITQRMSAPPLARAVLAAGAVSVIVLWRWVERRLHHAHVQAWPYIRQNGKVRFVIWRFVVLRGLVLMAVFIAPSYAVLDLRAILMFVVLSAVLTSVLGNQEWLDCENQYQANMHRDAATALRAMQN